MINPEVQKSNRFSFYVDLEARKRQTARMAANFKKGKLSYRFINTLICENNNILGFCERTDLPEYTELYTHMNDKLIEIWYCEDFTKATTILTDLRQYINTKLKEFKHHYYCSLEESYRREALQKAQSNK